MEDDESKKHTVATVPPPADAEDAYSAETKVGQAPAALLDLVRRKEEEAAAPPTSPSAKSIPPPVSARPTAVRAPPIDTQRSPAVRAEPEPQPRGLPPIVSIPLVFIAATIVLAAVVR